MAQRRPGVGEEIVESQRSALGAAAQRRLVDASREAARRERSQGADVTRPGDVDEFPGRPAHADQLDKAAEAGKRPVERARQPGRTVLVAGERGAGPLIRTVEEPDAGKAERVGDCAHLVHIGGLRAHQPAPGDAVEQRHQRPRDCGEPGDAGVAQSPRTRTALAGVAQRAAFADVDDGNGWKIGHRLPRGAYLPREYVKD